MKKLMSREDVEREAWFGGQKERVLALIEEIDSEGSEVMRLTIESQRSSIEAQDEALARAFQVRELQHEIAELRAENAVLLGYTDLLSTALESTEREIRNEELRIEKEQSRG